MSMLSSTCSSGTLLLIFCHGNHFLATFSFLSFNQLLKEKLHFNPQIDQLLESLVGCQWCRLGCCTLGPELGPLIQGLTFSFSLTPAWFILWAFLPRVPTGSLLFWGSHKGLGERITSITPPPVAWPQSNLLPPLCTCQIYPIKVFDGCPRYHTFSLFLFMMKFNKEKKPRQTKQKKTQRRKRLPFSVPVVLLADPMLSVPDCSTAGAGAAKEEMQGKKAALMISFFATAPVP